MIKKNDENGSLEQLDLEKITATIEKECLSKLSRLYIFDTIPSTNTFLMEQAKAGTIQNGTVCIAEHQTQGRGRRGRSWYSPRGLNIYCSLFWQFDMEWVALSGLSIAVAVMVATVLKKYGVLSGIQLKWPNDILFSGHKLGGILLEGNLKSGWVIGIGLNLNLPPCTEFKAISIQDILGKELKRNYLIGLLINELLMQLPVYQSLGLTAFIKDWLKYDILIDQLISVEMPEKTVAGIMRGLNQHGELLLEDTEGGIQSFCYGEVSVRNRF